ncbi:MAG: cell wall hydrolase [Lachnospiraceae bacterium]|nr:cell wall hydrolase [Lachnospiraceae bacterium]
MITLLALSLMLTACGREAEREGATEPVMEETTEAIQIEPVIEETPEPVPTEQPKKVSWSLDWSDDESYILAKIAMAEAEGEDTEGKALVILVVLNRVWDDSFPNTIKEVVMQENQFSPVANGRYDRVEPDSDCLDALELVMNGWDKSEGAMYFESRSLSTWHQRNLRYLFKHGNHYFYKEKEVSDEKKVSD